MDQPPNNERDQGEVQPKLTMAMVRDAIYMNIDVTEASLRQLQLLEMDLKMYGGNSPEAFDKRHELFEATQKVYEALRVLHQLLKETEGA
jgi:hypothetical protein